MKSPKAIVSVTNDLYTDQRVNKVCLFLQNQGYDVLLIGRKRRSSLPLNDRSYRMKRIKLIFEKGPLFYAFFNLRLFFFLLFRRADVLLSNDLDTLLANYLASKFKRRVKLCYDSHELFTEVPELTNRPRIQRIWGRIERWIFPKLKCVYTVNESIAAIYSKKYEKEVRVVRNVSKRWQAKGVKSKKELGIPENVPLLILQGAGINIDRGSEELIAAMEQINAVLMVVGDGDVLPTLKKYVDQKGLNKKVIFFGKKPYDVMMNYTYYADIGFTLDKATNANYKYSLPNKVFDYIHTETAIIATDLIEVSRVVRKYDIGIILNELSVESIVQATRNLLQDNLRLKQLHDNCKLAASKENWENECDVLREIYPKVES